MRLLTVPEVEAIVGSGVEQGGDGADLPGRCTYSRGGDVGSGVVQANTRFEIAFSCIIPYFVIY